MLLHTHTLSLSLFEVFPMPQVLARAFCNITQNSKPQTTCRIRQGSFRWFAYSYYSHALDCALAKHTHTWLPFTYQRGRVESGTSSFRPDHHSSLSRNAETVTHCLAQPVSQHHRTTTSLQLAWAHLRPFLRTRTHRMFLHIRDRRASLIDPWGFG